MDFVANYCIQIRATAGTGRNLHNALMEAFLDSVRHDLHAVATQDSHRTVLQLLTSITFSHIYNAKFEVDPPSRIHHLLGSCFQVLDRLCATSDNANANHTRFKQLISVAYLAPVQRYYAQEAAALARTSSMAEYCQTARRWLLEEDCHCRTILPPHMSGDSMSVVVETVLKPHLRNVVARNRDELLSLDSTSLSREISALHDILSTISAERSSTQGTEIVPPSMEQMVEAIQGLVLHDG